MSKLRLSVVLAVSLLLLVACGRKPDATPTPPRTPQQTPLPLAGECPPTTANTLLLRNDKHGYCALYPTGYDVIEPNPDETVLAIGSLLNVAQPRAYLDARDVSGQTAAQLADDLVAQVHVSLPDFKVSRSTLTMGGEEAVVLDNLPGQDINRRVLVVHGGRLYDLAFAPLGDAPNAAKTEELYKAVVDSWRFLPNPRGRRALMITTR